MRNWLINTVRKEPQYYKGILMHADLGLHEQAAALFREYVPAGSSVLDVGAGAGAFSRRLADLGYAVTALDVDAEKWAPEDIPFARLDVDKGLAASISGPFDAVCCLEVIEHVENPWNLLREAYGLVRPGGHLILSTPNVTSFYSRALFLRSGRFHQFDECDLEYGHINPITAFELGHAARRTGWETVEVRDGGYLPVLDLTTLRPFKWVLVTNALSAVSYLLARGEKRGWCLFFVLRKPASGAPSNGGGRPASNQSNS